MGFVLHYGAYLRDFWNILDFIVVAGAQFSMAVTTLFEIFITLKIKINN